MLHYDDIVKIITDSSRITAGHPVVRGLETELLQNILERKPIKAITGIRRAGKSFVLKRVYRALETMVPRQNLFFINFEHDSLGSEPETFNLRALYETFRTRADSSHRMYLFLDEIQEVPGWERFVRTIYDSTDAEIYITGSNSRLLSGELSSAIGGRILEYHLYPFSFQEFLTWQGIEAGDTFALNTQAVEIEGLLHRYTETGGLCETFNLTEEQITTYRNSLLDKILLKDVIERYRIDKTDRIKNLLLYLTRNLGSLISFSSLGTAAGVDDKTASTYTEYLCNTFALQRIDKFEWKTKRIFNSQKKIYAGDQLFTHLSQETRRLENLVFNHLCRACGRDNVYFLRDERGHEVDFLVLRGNGFDCYQVCQFLTDENAGREFRPLMRLINTESAGGDKENRFRLVYLKDFRREKTDPAGIELIEVPHFLLFDGM